MKYSENIRKNLNTILEKNYAAVKGYETAAESISETEIKNFFRNQSKQRQTFVDDLKNEILRFNETPKESTDFSSDMHRSWMKIRDFFANNDEAAVLNEVVRGEETAVESYNSILESTDVPSTTREMIIKQRDYIITNLEKLRNFELQEA